MVLNVHVYGLRSMQRKMCLKSHVSVANGRPWRYSYKREFARIISQAMAFLTFAFTWRTIISINVHGNYPGKNLLTISVIAQWVQFFIRGCGDWFKDT